MLQERDPASPTSSTTSRIDMENILASLNNDDDTSIPSVHTSISTLSLPSLPSFPSLSSLTSLSSIQHPGVGSSLQAEECYQKNSQPLPQTDDDSTQELSWQAVPSVPVAQDNFLENIYSEEDNLDVSTSEQTARPKGADNDTTKLPSGGQNTASKKSSKNPRPRKRSRCKSNDEEEDWLPGKVSKRRSSGHGKEPRKVKSVPILPSESPLVRKAKAPCFVPLSRMEVKRYLRREGEDDRVQEESVQKGRIISSVFGPKRFKVSSGQAEVVDVIDVSDSAEEQKKSKGKGFYVSIIFSTIELGIK
jgi:hypothetical protein